MHDRVIVDPQGKLCFKITNAEGHKYFRRAKKRLERMQKTGRCDKEKLYNIKKENIPPHKTLVTVGEFSTDEIISFCQLMMDADSKRKIKEDAQPEAWEGYSQEKEEVESEKEKKGDDRKKKVKLRNLTSKANQNVSQENMEFLNNKPQENIEDGEDRSI